MTLAPREADSVTGVTDRPLRVLVIFGGRSSEHEISCLSAAGVLRALDRARYDARAVGILPDGRWVSAPDDPDLITATGGRSLPSVVDSGEHAVLLPEPPGDHALAEAISGVDVVFPVLHGPWGEDGTIQGLLEMAGVPYVGSGVFSSAASMDKGHMKAMLAHAGLPIGDYVMVTPRDRQRNDEVRSRVTNLALPWFVKPARAGSSVGITRVTDPLDLDAALAEALRWDPRVIIEAGIAKAREIECGVLADADGTPIASRCAEIRVRPGRDFYDYEAKYLDDAADLIVPAELPVHIEDEVRALAVRAFDALDCEGLARVDFFVTDDTIVINEVNTMPGFTPISMYPRMWAATGVDYAELIDRLIADAVRRGTGLR